MAQLYKQADKDNSGDVSEEELASILSASHSRGELSKVLRAFALLPLSRCAFSCELSRLFSRETLLSDTSDTSDVKDRISSKDRFDSKTWCQAGKAV